MQGRCPPSTVYAADDHSADDHSAGAKRVEVHPHDGHENGEEIQAEKTVAFSRERVVG